MDRINTIRLNFKKFLIAGLFFLGGLPVVAQNILTLPFQDGFIGVQGANPQQATNVQNFSTLGVEVAYFQQNSSGALFEIQGNDIVGTVILVSSVTGETLEVPGAVVWRVTTGGTFEIIGFIPDPANPITNLSDIGLSAYSVDANSNFGLRLNSSNYAIVDGTSISGNAATSGALDALNNYLAEVQANDPVGPVLANDLTTQDTTPTINGTVTLGGGETFSVLVNGQTYDTSNGVTIDGSGNWQLTLPVTPSGTYSITAIITNASFYTLTDVGTLVINNCNSPDVPTITGDVIGICEGSTTTLVINGNLNDATQWVIYTGSCGGTLIGTSTTGSFDVGPIVDTTYYIRGEGGCVTPGSCGIVTVTVVDNIDPTITAPSAVTVNVDTGSCTAALANVSLGSATTADNCSVASTSNNAPATFPIGDTTVTWTVTDGSGNTATATQTVTVVDNINPVAICQDITIQLDATGNASIVAADIDNGSSDNCSVSSLVASTTSFTSADIGTNSVTLTVTDSSGNTAVCTATVTVQDNPVISTIDDIVVCEGDIITPVTFTVSDIYPGTALQIDVTSSNQNIILDSSFNVTNVSGDVELTYQIENGAYGQTTVSVTVTDGEGLSSVEQFTVQSSESVSVITSSGVTTVFSNGQDNIVDDAITVQSSQSISGLRVTIDSYQSGDQLDVSVALPAGVSKSFSSATGVLSITGSMTAAQAQDIFRSVVFSTTSPSLVDRQILFSLGSSIPFAGNDHFYEFVSAPSISFTAAKTAAESRTLYGMSGYLVTVMSQAENDYVAARLSGQGWMGASDEAVEGQWRWVTGPEAGTQFWQGAGNGSAVGGNYENWATGEPNNAGGEDYAHFLTNGQWNDYPLQLGSIQGYVVEYGGLESNPCSSLAGSKTIEIEPNSPPTAVCQDITVELDATGNITIVAGDIDGGSSDAESTFTLSISETAFSCLDIGENIVTLTVTDTEGLTDTCTAIVTVQDNIAPSVVTQDITVNLDGMGMATIVPADIDNGSTDNCTIDTYSLDIDSFDCEDVGTNTVTLTVVDVNGNSSQATAVVTVVDVTPPVIVCAPDVVTIMDPGVCYAEVFFADAIALDECGIASVVQTAGPASGSLFTQGVTTIEYTATDVNGNTTVCSFTITIQDTQIPTIASADDIAVSNDLGVCGAFVNVPAPTITDNCSQDPAPVVDGPVTPLLGGTQLLDTPSTVTGLSNSIGGDVTAVVTYNGDWSSTVEDFDLRGPDGSQVFFRDNQGVDCPSTDFADTFTISESTWNGWITTYGSDLTFTLLADTAVNPGLCANNFYQLSFTLGNGASLVNDYNGTADASDEYPVGTTVVTWTFTDIGGNVVTDTQTITVTDDEAPEMICIGEPGTFSITEDFEAGTLPNGWTNTALRGTDLWSFGSPFYVGALGQAFPTNAAVFDDDAAGSGTDNAVELASPVYNMSGAASATLSFDYAYNYLSPNEFFSVEVYDGTQWVEILRLLEDHTPTNTGALDMLPYANDSFQVRFTYDDGGSGWKWGVGIDNFQLDYDIPSTPLTIALDANGAATLDVSQLLLSATDNCGPVSTSIGGGAVPGSLSTTFAGGNGGADGGVVYFDLTAINDLTLESLQMHVQDPGTFTVDIYAIEGGTYVGNENNATPWALIGSGSGESNTTGTPSDVTLDAALSLTAGTTYAMALVLDATHSHRYTNGDGTNESFSDANMSVSLGSATSVPFTGTIFNPRVFNGTFNYFVGTPPSTTVDFDCSNLGDNLIEVTAVDSSGNVSTCISTVEVIDVTDPILVCQDATVSLDENGMAEVLPEYFINTDASFDACGITITAVDVTDVTCADIGAPITVTVFVSDASGNIASCQATMTVVDDMGPLLIDCPEDMTVDPGALDLFYELPDYTVDVTTTDNCTDPVGVISQDPPAGTLLPDGVYTITLSATDNEGNVGSCSFELTVESVLGVASNQLNAGVAIYPNPARKVMNIGNSSNVQLERALIYDINGRLIKSVDLGNMDREASVNVANLASGVYLVQLEAEGATAIKRLIKE